MLSVVVLFALVAYVDAVSNVTQCPEGCDCEGSSYNRQLTVTSWQLNVDCSQGLSDVDEEQLSHHLDSMLSADHFVEHLTSLSITNTPLTRVPTSVGKLLNLTSLNLDHNRLVELPDNCFTKLTNLVTLRATGNAITRLQDGLFDGLQSLVHLDLSYNQISFIGLRVFSNSSDLTSLRLVYLNYNRLMSLEPWWYYRLILGNETSPVTIKLDHNWISNFTNKLNFQYRCGMKPVYGYLHLDYNRIAHIMDMFNGWNLGDPMISLLCLANKRSLMKVDLRGASYACDCIDFPFYKLAKWNPLNPILFHVRCRADTFQNARGAPMAAASIHLNEFVCEQRVRCPSRCRCVYRPANITLHVNCSAANLSSLPLDLPPLPSKYAKYKLDFSNNKRLRRLEHRPYFVNTSILDVSNCGISEITVKVLKNVNRFSLVNFRGNMFDSFPRQVYTVNISARLLIGDNPWRCSCDNSWMIGWLQSLSHEISDPGDIVCRSPSRMYGMNVLKSTVEDFCVDPVKHALTLTLSAVSSVAAVILILTITGILVYKLRLNVFRRWKFHPFDRDECVGEDMDYDVFLCCSSLDDDPHGSRILSKMESNGYRVCYHERDFLPGQLITDNMTHGIERSKRTVCLISNNFMQR